MRTKDANANKYTFNSGEGTETILVNGTHRAAGFGITLSVKTEGTNTWKVIRKKDARIPVSVTWNLSADGSLLTEHYTGFNPNGLTNKLDYVYKRKAGGSGFAGDG